MFLFDRHSSKTDVVAVNILRTVLKVGVAKGQKKDSHLRVNQFYHSPQCKAFGVFGMEVEADVG